MSYIAHCHDIDYYIYPMIPKSVQKNLYDDFFFRKILGRKRLKVEQTVRLQAYETIRPN